MIDNKDVAVLVECQGEIFFCATSFCASSPLRLLGRTKWNAGAGAEFFGSNSAAAAFPVE
jgi:hypothetical protein